MGPNVNTAGYRRSKAQRPRTRRRLHIPELLQQWTVAPVEFSFRPLSMAQQSIQPIRPKSRPIEIWLVHRWCLYRYCRKTNSLATRIGMRGGGLRVGIGF
jgi:hypothetical protein